MQSVGRRYVRYVNSTYRRTGTLWEGRYKSALIDSEHYLLVCSCYIELNPVRAGMVNQPTDYRWSSYRANAHNEPTSLLQRHALFQALGTTADTRAKHYRSLFERVIDREVLGKLRQGTEREAVIGNERFQSEIEQVLQRRTRKHSHGGDRKSAAFR